MNDWKTAKTENFQYVKYQENEKYDAHYDAFDISEANNLARNYQRIITNIIYLNDDFEGGETFFSNVRF